MSRIRSIYGDFQLSPEIIKSAQTMDSIHESRMLDSLSIEALANHTHEFKIQNDLRGYFGKPGINNSDIGGHPDFDHLLIGDYEKGYVTTLFVDIQGSTRLGICYTPELVFFIKNQIIKCAIESVLALDGHVHRIMGDAVLAFFRGGERSPRNGAIDAINCATVLVEFIREIVVPQLRQKGLEQDVGIRIGIDYGDDQSVIWGMYGYTGVSEVTATSFYVDVAAKLQQSAPLNHIMLGQSVVELLDLHDQVIAIKTIEHDGERKIEQHVSPSYTNLQGTEHKYKQFVLRQDKYYELLPIHNSEQRIQLSSTIKNSALTPSTDEYFNCSRSVPKNRGIDFKARFPYYGKSTELEVIFRVENYGKDADKVDNNGNHQHRIRASRHEENWYFAHCWERTSYVGLHYMFISVFCDGILLHPEQCYAVYIG